MDDFTATGTLATNAGQFCNRLKNTTDKYPIVLGPGTIGISGGAVSVGEAAGTLTVTVTRTGGSAGAQTISYSTTAGTAIAGTHYEHIQGSLTWSAGDAASKTFAVRLLNDNRWTSPTQRVFTVSIALTSGDAALGTTTQTVTINENEPYAPGVIGFAAAVGQVNEGQDYVGTVVRTGGAVGASSATVTAPDGYTVAPGRLEWADGDSNSKTFTISGINATQQYDARTFNISLTVGGTAGQGTTSHAITVLDQMVTQTVDDYIDGKAAYEPLTEEEGFWFYNEELDAVRTEPLGEGEQSVLTWTAPTAGRLSFTWGQLAEGAAGSVTLAFADESDALSGDKQTNSVAVAADDVVSWIVEGGTEYVGYVKDMKWEPLFAVAETGVTPEPESKFQIDRVVADATQVTLAWQAGGDNPADAVQRLYAGPSATTMAEVIFPGGVAATSGENGVDLGIVTLDEAQGWVYWRVDTEVDADYGTAVAQGPVWRFAVVALPVFGADAISAGETVNVFLKAGATINVGADSVTPVTYTATGLPPGLKIDAQTGVISGTATRAGTSTVTVRATNSEGTTTQSFTLQSQGLPSYAKSTKLQGVVLAGDDDNSLAGALTFNVSATGRVTAKAQLGSVTQSFTGNWISGASDGTFSTVMSSRQGGVLAVALTPDGILQGNLSGQQVLARASSAATATPYIGYYTVALPAATLDTGSLNNQPAGVGYVTVTVRSKGQVKYSGLLADGTRLSGTATLMPFSGGEMSEMGYDAVDGSSYACFPLYKALYGRRGGMAAALVWIDARALGTASDNEVWLDNTKWYYPGKSVALTEDRFLATFTSNGDVPATFSASAVRTGAFFTKRQDLQVSYSGLHFLVDDFALPVTAAKLTLKLENKNALSAKLKGASSTGVFSGSFKKPDASTGRTKTFSYKGVLVIENGAGVGDGYYRERDSSTGAYRLDRSKPVSLGRL